MELFTILTGASIMAVFLLIKHIRRHRGHIETLNIPMDPPGFVFGSPPHAFHRVHRHVYELERHEKLGKTFGSYAGSVPVINTIDPEIVKSVCVKHADNFPKLFNLEANRDDRKSLEISHGEVWAALRKSLSPIFTSGKLKAMMEPMEGVADNMLAYLDGKVGRGETVVDFRRVFGSLSLETIAECAFGIRFDAHRNPDHPLFKNVRDVFSNFSCSNWFKSGFFHLFNYFPDM